MDYTSSISHIIKFIHIKTRMYNWVWKFTYHSDRFKPRNVEIVQYTNRNPFSFKDEDLDWKTKSCRSRISLFLLVFFAVGLELLSSCRLVCGSGGLRTSRNFAILVALSHSLRALLSLSAQQMKKHKTKMNPKEPFVFT